MLPLPDHIGPYRVLRKIGEGGMGLVLEAVHPQIERRVAIKLLRPEYARDPMLTERLFREALAVNRIEHPCVVQISEHGQLPDGSVYLVMEFLRGQTLAAWMEQHPGPAPVRLVLGLMVQITSALSAAHDKQVVHRDLKPENLMLLEDVAGLSELGAPRVKILDFGIAKVNRDVAPDENSQKAPRGHAKTATNVVMGTPQYMSPESTTPQRADGAVPQVGRGGLMGNWRDRPRHGPSWSTISGWRASTATASAPAP